MFKKLLKSLSFLFVISFFLFFSFDNVFANNSSFDLEKIKIEKGSNYINLFWEELNEANYYVLSSTDEILSNDGSTQYYLQNLEEGEQYELVLSAYGEKGNMIDSVFIKVNTFFNNIEEELLVDTLANSQSIKLLWSPVNNAEEYNIYKDGTLVEVVKGEEYVLKNLDSNRNFSINLETFVKFDEGTKNELREEMINEINLVPNEHRDQFLKTVEENLEEAGNQYFHSTNVKTLPSVDLIIYNEKIKLYTSEHLSLFDMITPLSLPSNTSMRYRAHIEDSRVHLGIYQFGGDNRTSFHATNGTHRVVQEVFVNWTSPRVTGNFNAGVTNKYNGITGNFIESATATCCGSVSQISASTSRASYNLNIDSSIPFFWEWVTPNIVWDSTSTVFRDGSYTASGRHKQFPSYGIFRNDGSSWRTYYTYSANQNGKDQWDLLNYRNFLVNQTPIQN